jgi:hypothetical protein
LEAKKRYILDGRFFLVIVVDYLFKACIIRASRMQSFDVLLYLFYILFILTLKSKTIGVFL